MRRTCLFSAPLLLVTLMAVGSASGCKKNPGTTTRSGETRSAEPAGNTIAKLVEIRADVQYRNANELVWLQATNGIGLSSQDAVKTGASSSGSIQFGPSDVLRVEERSMVIVLERDQKPEIDRSVLALPAGKVDTEMADSEGKAAEFVIRTPRGWVKASNRTKKGEAKPIKFSVAVADDGALDVRNESGTVSFLTQGSEKALQENEVLTVAPLPAGSPPPPIDLKAEQPPALPEVAVRVIQRVEMDSAPPQAPVAMPVETKPASKAPEKTIPKPEVKKPAKKEDGFRIFQPPTKSETADATVTVKGEMVGPYSAFMNGEPIQADSAGRFEVKVPLDPGANILTFQVIGPTQNQVNTIVREVTRK